MTVIESTATLNLPPSSVYQFLEDLNNHQQLMPENIYNWSSTREEATFTIQNMAKLSLRINNRIENREITAVPAEKPPFEVELKWVLSDNGKGGTVAKHFISADLNMMMKMLATGPLQKLADYQTQKLMEILGSPAV